MHLNDAQTAAVQAGDGHQLILAGAGSGKTRVLVHRIAWLIEEQQVSPYSILAVTFTNKAAGEMRQRVESQLGRPITGMWIGTFHGIAHRMLRSHWEACGLPENFQILDSDDQYRLVRRIMRGMNIDEKHTSPKAVQWFINQQKDEGLRAKHVDPGFDHNHKTFLRIYQAYEEQCFQGGLVDFAELLFRCLELLRDNPEVLRQYQDRFPYILVDEFQDTNGIQYAWLKLIGQRAKQVMIVGDDDQSIYGWRGARVENIQQFKDDFADPTVIRLEQNYRSTGNILKAANQLITNNGGRLGKNLWTDGVDGDPIKVYAAFNELDEARFIVSRIKDYMTQGYGRSDMAILYRSNAQSRLFEEALLRENIPYRIYGGLRFFDRAEIKDALAYLRLTVNRHDDTAFERVVNLPTRGIGNRTLELLRDEARARQISLWQAAKDLIAHNALTARAGNALNGFLVLIDELAENIAEYELWKQTETTLTDSGLLDHYKNDRTEKGRAKVENLEELITAARQFTPEADESLTPLAAFLAHAALEAGEAQQDSYQDCVQLMTLHSAKGLEFPIVFLAGLEDGIFPHFMVANDYQQLEEERRLCYVGITRAKEKLYFSHAEARRIHGKEKRHKPSRFISEVPDELLQHIRIRQSTRPGGQWQQQVSFKASKPAMSQSPHEIADTGLHLGQRVNHSSFGEGLITNFEGRGPNARVQVQFDHSGQKWLMVAYAKLQPA